MLCPTGRGGHSGVCVCAHMGIVGGKAWGLKTALQSLNIWEKMVHIKGDYVFFGSFTL